MPPFDRCANSRVMQEAWSRETRARAFLFSELDFAAELNRRALRAAAVDAQRASGAENRKRRAGDASEAAASSSHASSETDSEVKNIEAAWFSAHAVAAKNVAPHRLLLVSETAGSDDIEVVGCEPSASSSTSSPRAAEILRWTVPVSSAECHRMLYEEVQRRPMAVYQGARHPVNPVHRSETVHLCALIAERFAADPPPQWVLDRTAGGGVVAGSAPNGFALNTSARVAGSVNVAVERLEQSVEFQYGGLSEALLGNYPLPSLLVPQCCLVAQLCRAMRCRRALYLPEVGVSHAMLAHPLLWTQHAVMTPEQEAARSERAHAQQSSFAYPFQAVDRFQPNRARF
jgi:hypothetical protein